MLTGKYYVTGCAGIIGTVLGSGSAGYIRERNSGIGEANHSAIGCIDLIPLLISVRFKLTCHCCQALSEVTA